MSLLVDPHICPDCRAPLDVAGTCTGCGLRLVGPAAAELWERMQQADRLVEQLRAASATAPAEPAPLPAAPPVPVDPRGRRLLPSASVPIVLLALGGLCLLVAAVVFLAVTWGSLGLGAKTTIMLAVTALVGAAAVGVTRRGLSLAAETLWLVVAGMVWLDLGAAHGADLLGLGRIADRHAVALVGATLLGLGVGVGSWSTTTPLRRLRGQVAVSAVGIVQLAGAEAWLSPHNPLAVAVSVPALVALAFAVDRGTDRHLRPTAAVVAAAALVSWLELVGYGVDRLSTTATDRAWWSDLTGWPLLAAAVLAALPALAPRIPPVVRMTAAGGSLVTASLLLVGPSTTPTADLVGWALVSVAIAATAAAPSATWARPAAVLDALALLAWSAWTLARPLRVVGALPSTAPSDRQQLGLHLLGTAGGPAAWTAIVSVLVVGAAAASLLRHLPAGVRAAAGRVWIAVGPGALALGVATVILESAPTLLVGTLAWATALAVTVAMASTVRDHTAPLAASTAFVAYLVVVGVRLTTPSHLLAASFATAAALVLAAGYVRVRRDAVAGLLVPALGVSFVVLAGFASTQWPWLAGGEDDASAVTLACFAAAVLVAARYAGRDRASRLALETAALLTGVSAAAVADHGSVAAMVLTIVGSAVAVVAVLNRDREDTAWIALVVLGVATVIRLVEDVRAPEAYTLPAAALLLTAGWWRLDTDRRASSVRTLSSGLTLALVPSLLLCLDDPVSVRGALVAAGALAALAIGVARHWAAPFAAGAITAGVLAVRHLGPVVDGLPRWISLGSVGLALLVVGVTWEQRRRDVAASSRYLTALR